MGFNYAEWGIQSQKKETDGGGILGASATIEHFGRVPGPHSPPAHSPTSLSNLYPCLPGAPRLWSGRGAWLDTIPLPHPIDLVAPPSLSRARQALPSRRTRCRALKSRRLTLGSCPQGPCGFGGGRERWRHTEAAMVPRSKFPHRVFHKTRGNVGQEGLEEADNADKSRGRSGAVTGDRAF